MSTLSARDKAVLLAKAARRIKEIQEAEACELSLAEFYQRAWPTFDPADFVDNWHLHAIAEHLEAVAHGEIRRLLINVPPRTGKTGLCSICFPAWVWAQREKQALAGPHVSFLYASYAEQLSLEHSLKTRRLIESNWYRKHWGHRFNLVSDRNQKGHFENNRGGYRMATSVDAKATGFGADILVADDPHLVKEAESEPVRRSTVQWWTETMPSRLNDRKTGAMIIVMQRVHEEDLSGYVIANDLGYEHLMLPMRFDEARVTINGARYETAIGFADPRPDGGLLWPERLPLGEVIKLEKELGPYGAAGQLQQSPEPRGGGILKRDWWQHFGKDECQENGVKPNTYPKCEFILASLDTAYTEKEENDPSALTLWGIWRDRHGNPNIINVLAWEDRLQFHELVMRVGSDCKRFKVDKLIIEDKAAGHSVSQELRRLFGAFDFGIELFNPREYGDKVARVHAVVHLFSEGLVYVPEREDKDGHRYVPEWAEKLVDQCAVFPRGAHDDLVDSLSQALLWLRRTGLAVRREERALEVEDEMRYRPKLAPLYEV